MWPTSKVPASTVLGGPGGSRSVTTVKEATIVAVVEAAKEVVDAVAAKEATLEKKATEEVMVVNAAEEATVVRKAAEEAEVVKAVEEAEVAKKAMEESAAREVAEMEVTKKAAEESAGSGSFLAPVVGSKRDATSGSSTPPSK
jgi:hypothetical protein